jgi:hypothetical protein
MRTITIISILAALFLPACANYSGPSIGFTAGYEGVSVGLTLYGKPKAEMPAVKGLAK